MLFEQTLIYLHSGPQGADSDVAPTAPRNHSHLNKQLKCHFTLAMEEHNLSSLHSSVPRGQAGTGNLLYRT